MLVRRPAKMATRRTTDPSREKPSRIASTETRARGNLGPSPTSEVEARERAEPRRDARAASILHAALGYAARGWCVFPVYEISEAGICSCRKARDCDRPGKHPRVKGWQAKATTDVATLRWWWSQWSHANVGIATGARSGFVVLDVDPRHGGDASLAAFEAEDGELPATFTIATGGGGRHLWFAVPAGVAIANRIGIRPGLDVRADNGFVVTAPSNHASGNYYAIEADLPLASLPTPLLAMLTAGESRDRAHSQTRAGHDADLGLPPWIPDRVPEGERHSMAQQLAGWFQRQLYNPDAVALEAEIFIALVEVVRKRFEQPAGDVIDDVWLRQLAHAYARKPAPKRLGLRAQYAPLAETWEGDAGRTDRRVLLAILPRFARYFKRGEYVVPLPVLTVATMAGVGHDAAGSSLERLWRNRHVLQRVGRRARWEEPWCYRLQPVSQGRKGSRSYSSEHCSDPFRLCDNRDLLLDLSRVDGFGRVFPELCAALRDDRGQRPRTLARLAGCDPATAYRLLPRLAKYGLVVLAEDGWRLAPVDEAKLTVAASELGVLGKTERNRQQRRLQRAVYHAPASRRLRERRRANRAEAQTQLLELAEKYGWPTADLPEGSTVAGERAWRLWVKRSRTRALWTAKADLTRAVTTAKKHSGRTTRRRDRTRRRSTL